MHDTKLNTMMQMQYNMNYLVCPEWHTQGFNWYRAMWLEAAEAVEFTDYKWWKKGTNNLEQIKLELVDIWHFMLSASIDGNESVNIHEKSLAQPFTIVELLESLAGSALREDLDSVYKDFFDCLYAVDMTFDELFELYVGKNTLNKFRQANGYKDGTYRKIWNGVEDNVILTNLLSTLDSNSEGYTAQVYQGLQLAYAESKEVA